MTESRANRSKIHQVISGARASLNEPSRPYTPPSLDQRMFVDSHGGRGLSPNPTNGLMKPSRVNGLLKSIQLSNDVSKYGSEYNISKPDNNPTQTKVHYDPEHQSFKSILLDIKDSIDFLDTLSDANAFDYGSVSESLKSLYAKVDSLVPILVQKKPSFINEEFCSLLRIGSNLESLLLRWTSSTAIDKDCLQQICRICIRYYLSLIQRLSGDRLTQDITQPLQRIVQSSCQLVQCNKSEDSLAVGNLDVMMLEILVLTWDRLPEDLQREAAVRDADVPISSSSSSRREDSQELFDTAVADLIDSAKLAAGAIRNFSCGHKARTRLIAVGAVKFISQGLSSSLKLAGQMALRRGQYYKKLVDTLVETIGALLGTVRNFSLDKRGRAPLLEFEVATDLCKMLDSFRRYPSLLLNCARVTAKLSLVDTFRAQINERKGAHVKSLANVVMGEARQCEQLMEGAEDKLGAWPAWHTWPLLSRVCFTLGNLTTTNDKNRALIGASLMKPLVILLQVCSESISELHNRASYIDDDEEDDEKEDENENENEEKQSERDHQRKSLDDSRFNDEDEDEGHDAQKEEVDRGETELRDATVKLLRLLANLSIERDVGEGLAGRGETLEILMQLLRASTDTDNGAQEELLLNTIAACTNVSYYACQLQARVEETVRTRQTALSAEDAKTSRILDRRLTELSVQLAQCLFHENEEVVLETARVLGNLTRRASVLSSVVDNRTFEALLLLLAHGNVEVVTAVTGTLVNMSADARSKECLVRQASSLLGAFASLLRRVSFRDIGLHTLICQTLHNLLSSSSNSADGIVLSGRDDDLYEVSSRLRDSLSELVDCAQDVLDENTGDEQVRYSSFVRVGQVVLRLLSDLGI